MGDDGEVMTMAVEPGWQTSTYVPHLMGESYRVLWYPDGSAGFEHKCDRGDRGLTVCAPRLRLLDGGHVVVQRDPLTVEPSILCPDCGTHGYIRSGRWIEA